MSLYPLGRARTNCARSSWPPTTTRPNSSGTSTKFSATEVDGSRWPRTGQRYASAAR